MATRRDPTPDEEHAEPLRRARDVQRAAVDGGVDEVHAELCELRNLLFRHLRAEQAAAPPAADVHARITRHGQERLLTFIERLLAGEADDGSCTCLLRVAELRAMLVRQIRLESRVPARPA